MLDRMHNIGCEPDVVSYSAAAVACFNADRIYEMDSVLKQSVDAAASTPRNKDRKVRSRVKRGKKAELNIVYEDDQLIAVNKPAGMLVHPGEGSGSGDKKTLLDGLVWHCGPNYLSAVNGPSALGIVHRLDRGTSGIIVAAKDNLTHVLLVMEWNQHRVGKEYLTLVEGVPAERSGAISSPIDNQSALSDYQVLEVFQRKGYSYSLIQVRIPSGRRHQIRIHMAGIGHPVVGDPLYRKLSGRTAPDPNNQSDPVQTILKAEGKKKGNMLFLHAHALDLVHPKTQEALHLQAELSDYFSKTLTQLRQ